MLLLTAVALFAVFAILCWPGPFLGSGFGASCFRFHPAVPGCSLPFRQGPAGSDFIGIFFRRSPHRSSLGPVRPAKLLPVARPRYLHGRLHYRFCLEEPSLFCSCHWYGAPGGEP